LGDLKLESSAFENGSEIPKKFGYKYDNVNPPLSISGIPPETKSLSLIMDDPDAQKAVGKIWVHWVIWNIPPGTTGIDESSIPNEALEGKTDFGEIGYGGPAPPDQRHTYIFKLYALDTTLDIQKGSTKTQVENAMNGHIIAETVLKGTYAP